MYSPSQLHPVCVPFLMMVAAILCFAGLTFGIGHPHLSVRSTSDPADFYEHIAADVADSKAPRDE